MVSYMRKKKIKEYPTYAVSYSEQLWSSIDFKQSIGAYL